MPGVEAPPAVQTRDLGEERPFRAVKRSEQTPHPRAAGRRAAKRSGHERLAIAKRPKKPRAQRA